MAQADDVKLEAFRQMIQEKANAEKDQILKNMEEEKQARLEEEENRQLEEIYHRLQQEIAAIRTANVKEISRETLALKKEAYRQREQYLAQIIAGARAELGVFVQSPDYPAYLKRQAQKLAAAYPYEGSLLKVRPEDAQAAQALLPLFPAGCRVEADAGIVIGGMILYNQQAGIEADYTLSRALEEQRAWFYQNSQFKFE